MEPQHIREIPRSGKRPYDIPRMFRLIRAAIAPFPRAMLFEIAEQGYDSPFEQLIACILSIRTLDEVSLPAVLRVLKAAPTPRRLLQIPEEKLLQKIIPCTFPGKKAKTLRRLCEQLLENGGRVPCDFEGLTALAGVGPKCANLVLGLACGTPRIGVDIHVHRVTNRWGYVAARAPEKTLAALEQKLPRTHWVEINELLVPFSKHICTGTAPRCSVCPVLSYCRQIGVTKSR